MTHYVDVVALGWVEGNLREAVEVAKTCLHNYQRLPAESQHLVEASNNIHSATGALRLCALEPAALLSDEIEQVLILLSDGSISGEARKSAMTELVAALEAIPAYLASVRAKRQTTQGSLASIVNDLRQFGDRPPLPEEMFADVSEAEERLIQEDDLLEALSQTLQQLKTVISFLSSRQQQICLANTELADQVVPSLQQVSLQLHVVGLPELASTVNEQYKVLRKLSQRPDPARQEELLDFGGVISKVRDDIEFKLEYGLSAEGDTAALDLEAALTQQISVCLRGMKDNIRREFARRDLEALARTPIDGIRRTITGVRPIFRAARIAGETDLLNAAEHWDETGFPSAQTLLLIASKLLGMMEDDDYTAHARLDLDQVISVLGLLEDKEPECGVLHRCAEYFDSAVDHGGLINDDSMHCFAETVAALEQYMESRIADPQGDPSAHLHRAESHARELDSYRLVRANLSGAEDNVLAFSPPSTRAAVADSSHVEMADLLEPIEVDTASLDGSVESDTLPGSTASTSTGIVSWREAMSIWSTTSIDREALPVPEGPDAEIDNELRECLVEEAGDYFSKLQELVEKLSVDPTDSETIKSIRVVFHTMKGSARTIGLGVFGEFMHDMEVIFNRLRDNYFEGTAELTEFVRYVSSQLPYFTELIQQRIPLQDTDFEIPHTIASAIGSKEFDDRFTLEVSQVPVGIEPEAVTAEELQPQDDTPLPYQPEIWTDQSADRIMASVFARLAEPGVGADPVVLEQAISLADAVFPAILELRDSGVLEPGPSNVAVFLSLFSIEQLADGAIYGVVETPHGEQNRVAMTEETADTLQDYLEGVRRTDSLVRLHRSAVTVLCTCLSLEEIEDDSDTSAQSTDNVVPLSVSRTEHFESAEIDEELLDLFIETLDEYSESIDQAVTGLAASDQSALRALKNTLHTAKGAANSVGLTNLGTLVHDFESRIMDFEHAGTVFSSQSVSAIDTMVDELTQATRFVRRFKSDWDGSATTTGEELPGAAANDLEDDNATGDQKSENLRVETHRVDRLLDMGLEISMSNVRCRQSLDAASQDRSEVQSLARRVLALVDQLSLQLDTEIQAKTEAMPQGQQFDPLEMDRMTEKQGLAAILREAAYDLQEESRELGMHLDDALREAQSSGRVLQTNQSEMRQLRLVNFSKLGPGLRRLVHQVGRQLGKQVDFEFDCGKGGLDIRVFEQLRVALEHMLRNAIDHGIGTPEERRRQGKGDHGQLKLSIARSGSEFTIRLIDDGRGIDPDALRKRALETGLIQPADELSDDEALRLILRAGFTTAGQVTDISGRGVGMDVVYQSITQVGGTVEIQSKPGYFTQFDIRVPSSIMVNEALLATVGEEQIAIPLTSLKGSEFRRKDDVHAVACDPQSRISFRGNDYEVRYLGAVRGTRPTPSLDAMPDFVPVLFAQLKRRRVAFFADGLDTAEDMVIRALGSQYTGVPGIAGGAVKSDGQPVLALDLNEFIGQVDFADEQAANDSSAVDESTLVLCVDDSVMMRRTYEKRLASLGYTVVTAVDGADALDYLSQTSRAPDFIFTDLEMPNMNGFDFIANLRRVPGLKDIPTVVVSSRDGDKHRAEAQRVGASGFMAKGSNSAEGMQTVIEKHLEAARTAMVS